jgi:hypothetical protein
VFVFLVAIALLSFGATDILGINTVNDTMINLTLYDDSDSNTQYYENMTFFFANMTNISSGGDVTSNATCNITFTLGGSIGNPINMTYNSSINYFEYNSTFANTRVGLQKYNVSCLYNDIFVDIQDNFTITNRVPSQDTLISNVSILEEGSNLTINLYDYFIDGDGHTLNYSFNYSGNGLTLNVFNSTYLNVTGAKDWYGYTNFSIIVFDTYGGNVTSEYVFVNVSNLPEVSLNSPADASTVANLETEITFKAQVEDDFTISNCTLYGNFSGSFASNQTVNNPNVSSIEEVSHDDGSQDSNDQLGHSSIGTISKLFNLTAGQTIYEVKIHVLAQGTPDTMVVRINGVNDFNITATEVNSCSSEPCWVNKTVNNQSLFTSGTNNVTLNATRTVSNHYKIYVDTGNDLALSENVGEGDITGEYMIRLANATNILTYDAMTFPKGVYLWSTLCFNNQNVSKYADANYTVKVLNSVPSTPTVSPSSGTYDNEINISCVSTDSDSDNLTYDVDYFDIDDQANVISITEDDSDGNYTWNTTLLQSNLTIRIRCATDDGTNATDPVASSDVVIYHPDAPTPPTNLTCNSGNCTRVFNESINLSGIGAEDDGTFTYYFEAQYDDVNGTNYYFLGSIGGLNSTNATGSITWNLTEVPAQSGISVRVLSGDGLYNSSWLTLSSNVTVNNTDAPTVATNLTPLTGNFNISNNVIISTNGSTDPNGESLKYKVFAYYDSKWHLINGTLTNSTVFHWNFSSVSEQDVNISVQVTDGRYVTNVLRGSQVTLVKAPTVAVNITPNGNLASNVYEYELNYSCSGANNSNYFTYTIDMNYSNTTHQQYFTLNSTYPGVLPVNVSQMKYDDGSYSYLSHEQSVTKYRAFSSNVSESGYMSCITGYGTNAKVKLHYNCLSLDCDNQINSCNGSTSYQNLNSSEVEYCFDIKLNSSGDKYFCLESRSQSSGNVDSYIDAVTLTANAITLNTTNITPQKDVQLRCRGTDDAGNAEYLYSNKTIIIDRIPTYSGLNGYNFTRLQNMSLNLSLLFNDPDGTKLNFTVNTGGATKSNVTYNFSIDNNVTIADNTTGAGVDYVVFYASDGLVNKTVNVSIFINSCGDGICNYDETCGTVDTYNSVNNTVCNTDCNICTSESPSSGGGSSSSSGAPGARTVAAKPITEGPSVSAPAAVPPSASPSAAARTEKPVAINIFAEAQGRSVVHRKIPEPQHLFGTTKIYETIKNVDIYPAEDVKVTITIPKEVVQTTDEIAKDDTWYVVERDPVIEFPIGRLEAGEERVISYTIKKTISKSQITDDIFAVVIDSKLLTPEELQKRLDEKRRLVEKTKETVKVDVKYDINKSDGSAEIIIDVNLLDKAIKAKELTILSNIPKCLIATLSEEFRKKSIKSAIDFDVLKEDPLAQLNLGDIDEDKQFRIKIAHAEDIDCEDEIETEAFAKEFQEIALLELGVVDYFKVAQALFLLLIGIALFWYVSIGSGAGKESKHWLVKKIKKNLVFIAILFLFTLEILDATGYLPGDLELYKILTSFITIGYLIYEASITKVLFGKKNKYADFMLVIAFFLVLAKTSITVLRETFIESEGAANLLLVILRIPHLEEILVASGAVMLLFITFFFTRMEIGELSLVSFFMRNGNKVLKFFVIFLLLGMFYVGVYQISMEWFAIVIDSIVIILLVIFMLVVAIKRRKEHKIEGSIEEGEGIFDEAYGKFFKLFRFHRTTFLALGFIGVAFVATEIFIYILPYMFGLAQSGLYFAEGSAAHMPIWSIFGHENLLHTTLTGLPIHGKLVLVLLYLLNSVGLILLLGIPLFLLIHVYKNINRPLRHVDKSDLPTWVVALFMGSVVSVLLTPAFKIKQFAHEAIAGVDIQTQVISTQFSPTILGVLVASVIIGYLILHILWSRTHVRLGERKHYLLGFGVFVLCVGYILSYISTIVYGKVLFVEDFVASYETSYVLFVLLLAATIFFLVHYFTTHSRKHERMFEYIVAASVVAFFAVYYFMYVGDIANHHLNLVVHQFRVIEGLNVLRLFVLLFTAFLFVLEIVVLVGSFIAFIYILYVRNELGVHKYNIPFLRKFEQLYDLHHAKSEVVNADNVLDKERYGVLNGKIKKGLKEGFTCEDIIGHLLSHDWHIDDVHYAVLKIDVNEDDKQKLLYELYLFYSEKLQVILGEDKSPVNIAHDLAMFDCSKDFVEFEIKNSGCSKEVLEEYKGLKKLQVSKIESDVVDVVKKEEELEIGKPVVLVAKQKKMSVVKKIYHKATEKIKEKVDKRKKKKSKKRIVKIKSLIVDKLSSGHLPEIIISYLEDMKYGIGEIEVALTELERKQQYGQFLRSHSGLQVAVERMKNVHGLTIAIQKKLSRKRLYLIIQEAIAKGWKEEDIVIALKSVRLDRYEDRLIGKYLKN